MPLLVQDVIVTALAFGAVGLVVRRVFGVFKPEPAAPACTSCSGCPAPRVAPRDDTRGIPISIVNRAAGAGRQRASR